MKKVAIVQAADARETRGRTVSAQADLRQKWSSLVCARLTIFATVCIAVTMGMASPASALTKGLQWSGDKANPANEMETIGRSGAQLFRLAVEPTQSWTYLDEQFEAAANHGVTILPQIGGSSFPSSSWIKELVEHYGANGLFWKEYAGTDRPPAAWEVWNEPNNKEGGYILASTYGADLVSASSAIGEGATANETSKPEVLFGGLLSTEEGWQTYLKEAWAVPGVPGAVNGLAFHPYALSTPKGTSREEKFQALVQEARAQLNALTSGTGKSLWITEFGWPVKPFEFGVAEEEQATLLKQSLEFLATWGSTNNVPTAIWYNARDRNDVNGSLHWSFGCGLLDSSGNPRRAWWAWEEKTGQPFWPVASNWFGDNLAGNIAEDPTISSWSSNRLDVFGRGPDNHLYQTWWENGKWAAWQNLGATLYSSPGAVSWGPGRIDLTDLASNGSANHWWYSNGWFSDNLGGTFTSAVRLSSWGSNRLDVFGRGSEHALWHKFWNGLGWSAWEFVGGTLNSGPSAVSWENGRIDVVALAADDSVAHWWWVAGAWHSDNLGGTMLSDPGIASPEPGRLDVFGRGVENGLWHKRFIQGQGWTGWERVAGPIYSGPAAVAKEHNRIDVVGRTYNNSVGHWWWQGP